MAWELNSESFCNAPWLRHPRRELGHVGHTSSRSHPGSSAFVAHTQRPLFQAPVWTIEKIGALCPLLN
ncbi:Uncharacterized protein HZ326_22823 [Fusarium oxysporum f. sp. albedinis]|nr:Uncharacterized protein HZ326_22823 [Fusarium oxysporum f. sp. albedinis]